MRFFSLTKVKLIQPNQHITAEPQKGTTDSLQTKHTLNTKTHQNENCSNKDLQCLQTPKTQRYLQQQNKLQQQRKNPAGLHNPLNRTEHLLNQILQKPALSQQLLSDIPFPTRHHIFHILLKSIFPQNSGSHFPKDNLQNLLLSSRKIAMLRLIPVPPKIIDSRAQHQSAEIILQSLLPTTPPHSNYIIPKNRRISNIATTHNFLPDGRTTLKEKMVSTLQTSYAVNTSDITFISPFSQMIPSS